LSQQKNAVLLADFEAEIRGKMVKCLGAWQCAECDYSTKNNANLYEHIESRHISHPGYVCPHCSRLIATRNSLRNHIIRMHKKRESFFNH
jgi:ribosomal protein L37AE/L43A